LGLLSDELSVAMLNGSSSIEQCRISAPAGL
jgi:hypothetical protein